MADVIKIENRNVLVLQDRGNHKVILLENKQQKIFWSNYHQKYGFITDGIESVDDYRVIKYTVHVPDKGWIYHREDGPAYINISPKKERYVQYWFNDTYLSSFKELEDEIDDYLNERANNDQISHFENR